MNVEEISLSWDFGDETPKKEETKKKIKDAEIRKKQASESIEEAWKRIFSMKNSEKDKERLTEVMIAMNKGTIKRSPEYEGKRFTKAEAIRLYQELNESQRDEKLREMVRNTPNNYHLVRNIIDLHTLHQELKNCNGFAFDIETFGEKEKEDALDPYKGRIAGFSVSTKEHHFYVPLNHIEKTELSEDMVFGSLKELLQTKKVIMHNAPFDTKFMYVVYGINMIDNLLADTRVLAFLLEENRSHRLKDLISDWLHIPSDNFDELFGKTSFNEVPLDVALVYAAGDTEKTMKLYSWILKWFNRDRDDMKKLKHLCFHIEMPVLRQFIYADLRGIGFDVKRASALDREYEIEEKRLEREIKEMLGDNDINLNSPAQLSKKLYEEMKLSDLDKGSTGVKTLKKIKGEHPVIEKILEVRELTKLRSSFTQKLPKDIKFDGRIHPSHNSLGAKTGRFTCNSPRMLGRVIVMSQCKFCEFREVLH